jgi:hypothetical protein
MNKLTKHAKDLYSEKYKLLMKESTEDIRILKVLQGSQISTINLWKWLYYRKECTDPMQSHETSKWHSSQKYKSILKFIWKQKRHLKTKEILTKMSDDWAITIPDFKLCYTHIVCMVLGQKVMETKGIE